MIKEEPLEREVLLQQILLIELNLIMHCLRSMIK